MVDVAYLGPHVSCVVRTPDGELLTMIGDPHQELGVGDACTIGWPQASMWVLPLGPEAPAQTPTVA